MGVIGEFTVPAEAFVLETTLSRVPTLSVNVDRLASHSTMEVLPFLWASGADRDRIRRAFDADPTVTSVTVADEADEETLFRVGWHDEFHDLVDDMVDHHAAISRAAARDGRWHLQLRFAEEEMISDFQRHFEDTGRRFEVERLTRTKEPRQRKFGLTARQYDALTVAAKGGYFSVPRDVSMDELGERLDISANAASQRLRRGCETLVRSALAIDGEENRRE